MNEALAGQTYVLPAFDVVLAEVRTLKRRDRRERPRSPQRKPVNEDYPATMCFRLSMLFLQRSEP